MKKSPLFALLPAVINTGLSLIKDKKAAKKETDFVHEEIEKGVQISSKRVLSLVGTGAIVSFALADMSTNGINQYNLIALSLGVAYAAVMTFLTARSEK
jgi:hypothetical protein